MPCSMDSCRHWTESDPGCKLEVRSRDITGMEQEPPGDSLVLSSLDIGKALADRGRVLFRAQGTCMYPLVRPGDVLHLASRTVDEIAVGDIAVCRRPGYLFAHRAIGKGTHDGKPYVLTRPDRVQRGGDGPSFDEDVLGIVACIERRGRRVPTHLRRPSWLQRRVMSVRLAAIEAGQSLRSRAIAALTRLQRSALYRSLARALLSVSRTRASYVVRLPFGSKWGNDIYRPLTPEEFDVSTMIWQGRPVDRWILALHLAGQRQPAAWASFVLRPPNCPEPGWRMQDMHVRVRYRGGGLDTDLRSKAVQILAEGGAALEPERASA